MSTRMLIDARHDEETRVAIVNGSRLEDFDYESSAKKQLKGNIYLARITRVEPSLQAAFVEYGGNRHGFLAFSEIHPDYYQIPAKDLEEIKAEEEAALVEEKAREEESDKNKVVSEDATTDAEVSSEINSDEKKEETAKTSDEDSESNITEITGDSDEIEEPLEAHEDDPEEFEDAVAKRNYRALKRRYKIQEVIKRRQVILIQVVKEERGNKGAALTTYLSLAGRYCVLMPNSTHSGGISRKISSQNDRRRLKGIVSSLEVPNDMGLILRTAGLSRTKTEIKRDYDYLLRLWDGIRNLTLRSVAPTVVYEEGSLIKRAIRDLYTRDIDEILVEGDGYRAAKDFMKLLMPSHSKKVQHYQDRIPLFHRYQVEGHMASMYDPIVQLKSGGYIVINPTEALISVDVNSGRSTKEKTIEETAVKTNLEAADELGRQLKLRDMAGLVVIDFIDMDDRNNNRSVERRMKEALKNDRARIQIGRISSFGLMEMSRQRLRPNLLEASMTECGHCKGTGVVRTIESAALMALRELEEEGIRNRSALVKLALSADVAIFLLNRKREELVDLESRYNYAIEISTRTDMGPSDMEITHETVNPNAPVKKVVTADTAMTMDSIMENDGVPTEVIDQPLETASQPSDISEGKDDEDKPKRKRRRRRRRKSSDLENAEENVAQQSSNSEDIKSEVVEGETPQDQTSTDKTSEEQDSNEERKPRRRRGSRGGRRRNNKQDENAVVRTEDNVPTQENAQPQENESSAPEKVEDKSSTETEPTVVSEEKPRRTRTRRPRVQKEVSAETNAVVINDTTDEKPVNSEAITEKPKSRTSSKKIEDAPKTEEKSAPAEEKAAVKVSTDTTKAAKEETENDASPEPKAEAKAGPKKKGWWSKVIS